MMVRPKTETSVGSSPQPSGRGVRLHSENAVTAQLIRFEGFGKSFGTAKAPMVATRGIDLEIARGEFITIVGPSGCGKSTLLNATAGIFAPTEGRVFYGGVPVAGYNQRVGYMTQSDHLLPWRKVDANIALPLEIQRRPKTEIARRVEELIELVGLTGFGNSYVSQLSGGMRKRCALARLLAYDPDTLLMDEPFGALDAQLRLAMQVQLRNLCTRLHKTVLFVTHDIDEAVALGDRCVVLTGRPGTVREIVTIDLPRDRNLYRLRSNRQYIAATDHLWGLLAPDAAREEGEETP
ncbi:ABC transporter, ATP-binding protein (cluster 1, maltose/g3p/polyamine/iron); ABC transporter, ATP-binding protein (cluster 10, nitrate/sulfonate/bicarbonate) [Azospirillum endophyticum]